jgi:FSR family fosmidomycin resistance protein-like MFS transporter
MFICPVITGICAILLFTYGRKQKADITKTKIIYRKPSLTVLAAVICFMLTIVIRSLIGTVMDFSWKSVPYLSFAFVFAVALGKALGGFLADRFGKTKTAAVSLSVSLIAFIFSFRSPALGIIAVLCFNMTMPLTLTAIAGVCNNKNGFAFGLTTFALALGFVPVVFSDGSLFTLPMLICSVISSLILLVGGLSLLKRVTEKDGI